MDHVARRPPGELRNSPHLGKTRASTATSSARRPSLGSLHLTLPRCYQPSALLRPGCSPAPRRCAEPYDGPHVADPRAGGPRDRSEAAHVHEQPRRRAGAEQRDLRAADQEARGHPAERQHLQGDERRGARQGRGGLRRGDEGVRRVRDRAGRHRRRVLHHQLGPSARALPRQRRPARQGPGEDRRERVLRRAGAAHGRAAVRVHRRGPGRRRAPRAAQDGPRGLPAPLRRQRHAAIGELEPQGAAGLGGAQRPRALRVAAGDGRPGRRVGDEDRQVSATS